MNASHEPLEDERRHEDAASVMTTLLGKRSADPGRYSRSAFPFENARSAISGYFRGTGVSAGETVLCPAYIGWSPREGSGVLDPLESLGLHVDFYRVTDDLGIDIDHLQDRLKRSRPAGVLVIPFFGHVPTGYRQAIAVSREAGALVLEDEAHAMLTDLVAGTTGRLGDAAVLSLHKLLPVRSGGALLLKGEERGRFDVAGFAGGPVTALAEYDLPAIAAARRGNVAVLIELLEPYADEIVPLWSRAEEGEVLHSFPVLVRDAPRDEVYEVMNNMGLGVVSLYHTLVEAISPEEFPISHRISRSILNLPVHQEVSHDDLEILVRRLVGTVRQLTRLRQS